MVEGGFVVHLVEWRSGFSRVAFLGKLCVAWLKSMVEALVRNPEVKDFIHLFRERSKAFIIQRGSNRLGWYVEVVSYAVGGCRGLIVIPEEALSCFGSTPPLAQLRVRGRGSF